MKRLFPLIPALLLATLALPALILPAKGADKTVADWKAEEQSCIDKCPEFPRFSGTESDEQYRKRLEQEDAYNACHKECVRNYLYQLTIPRKAADDGTPGYYERNAGMDPEYPSAP